MQEITERQKNILETLVDEHIKNAFPISSDFLHSHYGFNVSPATIRMDLFELTKNGFLEKTHISGGRVPTDKGYRFFVNRLLESKQADREKQSIRENKRSKAEFNSLLEQAGNLFELSHEFAKNLALLSSNLGVAFFEDSDLFFREGIENVAKAPEFKNIDVFKDFLETAHNFEENFSDINLNSDKSVKVFIGEELPFGVKKFSVVIGRGELPKEENKSIVLGILGPKRMDFKKNIYLIESIIETIENYG